LDEGAAIMCRPPARCEHRAMDLTSAAPFWLLRNGLGNSPAPLRGNARCEVVVIGAGVTGALIADALCADGRDVMALDRRQPGLGSTAASTALLQYEIDTHLVDLIDRVGKPRAEAAYLACRHGLAHLRRLCRELDGGIGLHARPSVYLASRRDRVPALRAEARARQRLGLSCRVLGHDELRREFELDAPLALATSTAAEVDPWRLTQALLARSQARGLRLHGRTHVRAIETDGATLRVRTDRGDVRAHHVVVACGYEAGAFLPHPVCTLHTTFALATDPLAPAELPRRRPLVWETARPYYYLRTGESNRVLIGGCDERFHAAARREAALARKWPLLLARAKRWLPGRALVPAHAWAGVFGQTRDGLAYIGAHPRLDPRVQFALGYGGNGITFSAVAAEVVAARIAGRRHRFADTFAFDR
jgi:glycine/D-amino acid oxidase-like deaminating enzyme